ncbi:MAG: hypothetical protein AMJ43_08425 [Coxiella sp. DG_40]|nr:MAG: hypothetical protein AMJ43_08425 [Coxiella sp. DG_40]
MIAPSFNSLCNEAELYYYDFLFNEIYGSIPEFIINHINQCQHCQEQINQLKDVLSQAESHVKPEKKQVSSAITEMLKLHFAYIGKPVACETVRPFLPTLLEPALKIRMPTPITAHLDNCPQCSKDLESIRKLNLSRKQLRRLSQLFAKKPGENNISCSQAQAAILAFVTMAFHKINKEVLKHLCICPDCRQALYQYRDIFRAELLNAGRVQEDSPCEQLSSADIFDYVVPYGLNPASDEYAKFRESLTQHMRACPACLAKMQQLHDTVYGIAERAESMVVTIYHIDESAKAKAISESDDPYAGFPMRVEVASGEDEVRAEQPRSTVDFGTALKQKVSAKRLKPLLKMAAVAAAILIGVALFLTVPTAKGITIERLYKALEKVKNVHIASFVPDKKEPVQEQWVSRTLNVNKIKTEKESVLWDLPNKVKKVKHLDSNSVETTTLSAEMIAEIQNTVTGSLGLMPFYDISDVPPDAKWSRVDKEGLKEVNAGIEIYDLEWLGKTHRGSDVFCRWRVFVDPETKLPQNVERYQKLATDSRYNLIYIRIVEYLSDNEMQEIIKDTSF